MQKICLQTIKIIILLFSINTNTFFIDIEEKTLEMLTKIPGGVKCVIFTFLVICMINMKSPVNALSQPLDSSSNFVFSRNLRAPFQHKSSTMMTARGFGKRSFVDYDNGWESNLLDTLLGHQNHQMRVEEENTKRSPHIMGIREPRLRFRLADDGNLRIGRGFGKRSLELGDGQKEECKNFIYVKNVHEYIFSFIFLKIKHHGAPRAFVSGMKRKKS